MACLLIIQSVVSVLKYFNQRLYNVDARWGKILSTLCLLEITWNNKGYPVKLVYKCMYVRVITRMTNSLPMT